MSNLSEVSDFDINEQIAILHGSEDYDGQVRYGAISYTDKDGVDRYSDWCNNWADAGHLMADLKDSGFMIVIDSQGTGIFGEEADFQSESENTCRGMAECYLMAKGVV